MTPDKLVEELDRVVQGAGPLQHLGAADPQPHRHAGDRHQEPGRRQGRRARICRRSTASPAQIERVVKQVPGVTLGASPSGSTAGATSTCDIDRDAAARYGLNIADVQSVVSAAIGGDNIGETVEGLQRFPINVRYPREMRDSVEKLRAAADADRSAARRFALRRRGGDPHHGRAADAEKRERAPVGLGLCRHARARPAARRCDDMQRAVAQEVKLPPGYSISWSGQFEYLERATREAEDRGAGDAC